MRISRHNVLRSALDMGHSHAALERLIIPVTMYQFTYGHKRPHK